MIAWMQERIWWFVAILAVAGIAFAGGWLAHPIPPARVQEVVKEVAKEVVKEVVRTQYAERVVVKRVFVDHSVTESHRVEEHRPDGTTISKEDVVRIADVTTQEGAVASREATRTMALEQTAERTREATRTVTSGRPDWRLGLQIGASLRPPALPLAGPLVLGVAVDRRVYEGVLLGAWANTSGAGGMSVGVEF